MTQTFVGKSTAELPPEISQRIAEGAAGSALISSMLDSVSGLLDAHDAPQHVRDAFAALQSALIEWAKDLSAKVEATAKKTLEASVTAASLPSAAGNDRVQQAVAKLMKEGFSETLARGIVQEKGADFVLGTSGPTHDAQ